MFAVRYRGRHRTTPPPAGRLPRPVIKSRTKTDFVLAA